MFKEIKSLFSFLTILTPTMDEDCFITAAKTMYLFPLVGAFIGLLAGLFGWVLYHFLPGLVVGVLVLSFLLLMTGIHHTDGLLDLGDGLMAHGSAERKIEIMHDQLTGAGGLSLGIMTLMITAFSIAELDAGIIIQGLVVAEVSAKLSMVMGAWAGREARPGMASTFLEAMHGKKGHARLIVALAISFGIALPLLWLAGAVIVLAAILTSLVMVGISHRHFKGVTGDVLGATNELARMVSLIMVLAVISWL
jgi:adenosylcobinamide-GDP ribazoletransferase